MPHVLCSFVYDRYTRFAYLHIIELWDIRRIIDFFTSLGIKHPCDLIALTEATVLTHHLADNLDEESMIEQSRNRTTDEWSNSNVKTLKPKQRDPK
jgi:hypothetical protein